jgi:predicted alpha/beta-fold hydrolase
MDLEKVLNESDETYSQFHDLVTSKQLNLQGVADYLKKASPYFRIKNIRKPTMFMNALNDPFMGDVVIDYDVFKENEFTVLATNKYGGHMGYHEDLFSLQQWLPEPCLNFLEGLRED